MNPLAGAIRELLVQAIADTGSVESAAALLHGFVDAAAAPSELEPAFSKPDRDGLVIIRAMHDFKRQLLNAPDNSQHGNLSRLATLVVPDRVACKVGLDQLPEGSDLWHAVRTEMAWAALGENNAPFGNPEEIARVNRYKFHSDETLIWRRIERLPFEYHPYALAFSAKFATADAVVAEVKRRVRESLERDGQPAPGVDFSPLPPLP